jgi:AcrR family transcriptional regulator
MPRWEKGSKERLQHAATELFEEQGFEATTAVQIAERARVTTRTFFRYFSDKQEVLFADAEALCASLAAEIRQTTDVTEPLRVVTQTLAGFNWESLASRESLRRRDAMIAANPGLRERNLNKQRQMAEAFGSALHQRGVDLDAAELATQVGIQVFGLAYQRWLEDDHNADLATITKTMMSLLATIVPAIGPGSPSATAKRRKKAPESRAS